MSAVATAGGTGATTPASDVPLEPVSIMPSSKRPILSYELMVALFYGAISIITVFTNKTVLTVYNFHFENVVLLIQMMITVVLLWVLKRLDWIQFEPISWGLVKKCFPVAACYTGNVACALASLTLVTVPTYSVLKRLTVLSTLVTEYLVLNITPTTPILSSVLILVLGAVIAGASDMYFHLVGYIFGLGSVCFQTAYLILLKRLNREDKISTLGMLFMNNLLSLPLLLVITLANGELAQVRSFPDLHDGVFQAWFVLSLVFGILLNYSIFLCTTVNSPLTTTVVGQCKGVLTTALGFIVFGPLQTNVSNLIGLVTNTIGGSLYAYYKSIAPKPVPASA